MNIHLYKPPLQLTAIYRIHSIAIENQIEAINYEIPYFRFFLRFLSFFINFNFFFFISNKNKSNFWNLINEQKEKIEIK